MQIAMMGIGALIALMGSFLCAHGEPNGAGLVGLGVFMASVGASKR
jgi:hypothetical protein